MHPHWEGFFAIFFKNGSKIGLEFTECAATTSGAKEIASQNFATCRAAIDEGNNTGTTFGRQRPLKIWESKNVQNLVRFRTTFDFDCKYLWNL